MSICCCSLAGTAACKTCKNNPDAELDLSQKLVTINYTPEDYINDYVSSRQKKKAEWIKMGDEGLYCCSNCASTAPYYLDKGVIYCWPVLNYCPNCGAEMPRINLFTQEENECVVGCDGDCESCPLR